MKLKTNILLALAATTGVTSAAVIAQDDFSGIAEGASIYGTSGGSGFSDSWSSDADGTYSIQGGRAVINPTSGTTESFRTLTNSLTDGDNVWFGVTLDISGTDATRFFGMSPFAGGTEEGLLGTSSNQLWSLFADGTHATGVSSVTGDPGSIRMVMNLDLQAGADTARIWVVTEGGAIDLSTPDATASVNIGTITRIRMGAGAGNGTTTFTATGVIDDLVIGTEATDVVNVTPEPSSTALLGLGGLALILRRRK